MSNDGSLATKTEDWIVSQVSGIEAGGGDKVFESVDVKPWEGTEQDVAGEVAKEVLNDSRDKAVRVWFVAARRNDLAGCDTEMLATYAILIAVKSGRAAAPRRGDDTTAYGTNAMRDLLFNALDRQQVNASANGRYANDARFMSWDAVLARKNANIYRAIVEVRETPAG